MEGIEESAPRNSADKIRACVVIAEFDVERAHWVEFGALARGFAAECMQTETGCLQFDVIELLTTDDRVIFYEAYADNAAFEAHCRSPHLSRFKAAFPNLIRRELPLRRGVG